MAISRSFSFLKNTSRLEELFVKGIPVDETGVLLVPVCELHADDDVLIRLLAQWRAENEFAYPTRFPVTEGGTKSWLRTHLLDVEDRILFLVLERHGRPMGHLGFASCFNDECSMEIDNVVRGMKESPRGLMASAMRALLTWARTTIGPRQFTLRVLDDNARAIQFYRKTGFVDNERIPLRRHERSGITSLKPIASDDHAPPDACFLRMAFGRDEREVGSQMILTAGPSISARETFYAFDAARNGWNSRWNGYLNRFEKAFAEYLGVPHAIATSSCTGALHIALCALGIGPGDEVIVPDITWVATANAVAYAGATPVFADVELDTWCLDSASFESKISGRTKAVIPVHLYGHPARMDRIMAVARKHGLFVIEDAAPAIGAEYAGGKAGTFGDFAAFSFQGAKLLVTGEGGMLVTNDAALHRKALKIWDQGRDPNKTFWIDERGLKYKMANIQAAIGLGQLERVDELVAMKRKLFDWYSDGLSDVAMVTLNREVPNARSIYWMTSVLLGEEAPVNREELRAALKRQNVDTRPVFPPISQYPIWSKTIPPEPVATRIGLRAMNLPSGVCLTREDVAYVCNAIRQLMQQ